jgi:hypothetical protein
LLELLSHIIRGDLQSAVSSRSPDFLSLTWLKQGGPVEIAVELEQRPTEGQSGAAVSAKARYAIAFDIVGRNGVRFVRENLTITQSPLEGPSTDERIIERANPDWALGTGITWDPVTITSENVSTLKQVYPFSFESNRAGLGQLPMDTVQWPIATWVRQTLSNGITPIVLNCAHMRKPAPPGASRLFQRDGSNLPFVISDFRKNAPQAFERWIAHLKTALPDLNTVGIVDRPEDGYRYLKLVYQNGLQVPSWVVSDGTLRLIALTLIAYLQDTHRVYLIEEPENGLHPSAIETVFQSLSSAYDQQILCTSHSPLFISLAEPKSLLCFTRDENGETRIVRGDEHPILSNWKRETDLGTLFAAGVLD